MKNTFALIGVIAVAALMIAATVATVTTHQAFARNSNHQKNSCKDDCFNLHGQGNQNNQDTGTSQNSGGNTGNNQFTG